jgi:hypothetical protein
MDLCGESCRAVVCIAEGSSLPDAFSGQRGRVLETDAAGLVTGRGAARSLRQPVMYPWFHF